MSTTIKLCIPPKRKIDSGTCAICQKKTKEKLTSTENGRNCIIEASKTRDDHLSTICDMSEIKYHMQCYRRYRPTVNHSISQLESSESDIDNNNNHTDNSNVQQAECDMGACGDRVEHTSSKQRKLESEVPVGLCIICNQVRCRSDNILHPISGSDRAELFIQATTFNLDEVHSRCATFYTKGSILAANIMSHNNCMNRYLKNYQRSTAEAGIPFSNEDTEEIQNAFKSILGEINVKENAYSLSDCRDEINKKLEAGHLYVSNRKVKTLLIEHFGENICFMYPSDKSKSQMFFSPNLKPSEIVETIRVTNPVKICAEELKNECRDYNFGLDDSYCDASDVKISNNAYVKSRPKNWSLFFEALFPSYKSSDHVKRKCDTLFQIAFYLLHNGLSKTPLHVDVAETIHDLGRSRQLITLMHRLGISLSYGQMKNIDNSLRQRTIDQTVNHRVPVPTNIQPAIPIHAAIDNFDRNENTSSGMGTSHDTILMLFQAPTSETESSKCISKKSPHPAKPMTSILECQEIIPMGQTKGRGEIPQDFVSTPSPDYSSTQSRAECDYVLWEIARTSDDQQNDESSSPKTTIPSFTATNSILITSVPTITNIAYTPIIPNPATERDSIYTSLKNFQDVLIQKDLKEGALWCDEGVYRIAKEIQLLRPVEFRNIFIGLGGFHMEKAVLACLGKYLEDSGVVNIFIEKEIFGPSVTESVMSGGNYARSKKGMYLLGEAMTQLQIKEFRKSIDSSKHQALSTTVTTIQNLLDTRPLDVGQIRQEFDKCSEHMPNFIVELDKFVSAGSKKSPKFCYWNTFLKQIFPVLRDLTRSHREGNWTLHMSAVRRAITLFFAFDRINYSRWAPLYYEDCLKLPTTFPLLDVDFRKGNFVVQQTERSGSSVPMDQALEMCYNKPAKGPGGIIGVTRRKEAVAQWNILKHEKGNFTTGMLDRCCLTDESEYSVHHEFQETSNTRETDEIVNYISLRQNPFDTTHDTDLANVATGQKLTEDTTSLLLNTVERGEAGYTTYKQTRLDDKSSKLFEPIRKSFKKVKVPKTDTQYHAEMKLATSTVLKTIDYARLRNYSITNLLTYEICDTSYFLTKDGVLRKSPKAELTRELEKTLKVPAPPVIPVDASANQSVLIVDFMAIARKVPVKKANLRTYDEFMRNIWNRICYMSRNCSRIDIVFDLYITGSVKECERNRRGKVSPIDTVIYRPQQQIPVQMDNFWASSSNKMSFESLFISWLGENADCGKDIYLGGCHKENEKQCRKLLNGIFNDVPSLTVSHEEADERMMVHIQHAVEVNNIGRVLVASADTDVMVCLLFHFKQWAVLGLRELWVMCGQGATTRAVPVHDLADTVDPGIVRILPAVHALSGCDSTSKVGTKSSAFKTAGSYGQLLESFGKAPLCADHLLSAETFLVKILSDKNDTTTFDQLRHSQYHKREWKFDLEKLPTTSTSIHLHIRRAYLQCYKWINATSSEYPAIDATDYGYEQSDSGMMVPQIVSGEKMPHGFPMPCNCLKCAKATICPCRVKKIKCCEFCRCRSSDDCRNPCV